VRAFCRHHYIPAERAEDVELPLALTKRGVLADDAATRPRTPSEAQVLGWSLSRGIAAAIMHTYAMRMAAVFTMSTANIGFRTKFIPRWLTISGYVVAGMLEPFFRAEAVPAVQTLMAR
jgi:hypothetical protein